MFRSKPREELPDLAGLSDVLSDALVVLDDAGRPTYVNPAAFRLVDELELDIRGDEVAAWVLHQLPGSALDLVRECGRWHGSLQVPDCGSDEATLRIDILRRVARPEHGVSAIFFMLVRDISESVRSERELQRRHSELQLAYARLSGSQQQLLQSEKMASIGELAAGVAHEINNPIGYVHSNLATLQEYLRNLISLLSAYDEAICRAGVDPETQKEIRELRVRYDIDFVSRDLPNLLDESREGIDRVCKIVRDLKEFSHTGREETWSRIDLHRCLDSTLNIVWNELKYKTQVSKHYAELPAVECLPSQINQVFMNLLMNAGQAIRERGQIVLRSGCDQDEAWVSITDDGVGIAEGEVSKIFNPFFTSKPVGEGTGLGLSISYGIIAKHHGRIEVESTPGSGSTFRVVLPIRQPESVDSPPESA